MVEGKDQVIAQMERKISELIEENEICASDAETSLASKDKIIDEKDRIIDGKDKIIAKQERKIKDI